MSIRSDFYDPLYKKAIFPHRGVWSALSSQREDAEILGDYVTHLFKIPDIYQLAMRPAGNVAGLANPSSFFSNLEHALGVSLLGILACRRIKIGNSILRSWLELEGKSIVDEFLLALFLRGLYFTTYTDIVLFLGSDQRKTILELLLDDINKYGFPENINKYQLLTLLGAEEDYLVNIMRKDGQEQELQVKDPRIETLRDVFLGHSILNLSFLDRAIRTAFYIGSPIGKALEQNFTDDKSSNLTERIRDFFYSIKIEEKPKEGVSVTIIDENKGIPISKAILSTCRELIIKLDERGDGLGYTSIGKRYLYKNMKKVEKLRHFLLNGFTTCSILDPDEFSTPDVLICQGIPIANYEVIATDLSKVNIPNLEVLIGTRFPTDFLNLRDSSYEHQQYRKFCKRALPPDGSILIKIDKDSTDNYDQITTAQQEISKLGKIWFKNPRIIHPKDF